MYSTSMAGNIFVSVVAQMISYALFHEFLSRKRLRYHGYAVTTNNRKTDICVSQHRPINEVIKHDPV